MNVAGTVVLMSGAAATVVAVGILTALIGGLICWAVRFSKKTRQANEDWAQQMGFQYELRAWPLGDTHAEELALMNKARRSDRYEFKNVFRGRYRHREVTLFDVDYVVGQDQDGNDIHREVSVAAFSCPGRGVPQFEIHPQNLAHKLKNKVVNKDITLEDMPEFSRKYYVQGADAEAVRSFLPGSLLNHLAGLPKASHSVEGGSDWILIYANRVSAKNRTQWLDGAVAILEALHSVGAAHA